MGQEIHALADVVWPATEASALQTKARHLAEALESQALTRSSCAAHARDGWAGRFRTEWDANEEVAVADARTLIANLRAMADAIGQADNWVHEENEVRRRARDKEADDQTWFGLKDNVVTMAKTVADVQLHYTFED